MPGFDATPFTTLYGGRVGLGLTVPSTIPRADLLAAPGRDPSAPADVEAFDYRNGALVPALQFTAFGPGYGVNVADVLAGY